MFSIILVLTICDPSGSCFKKPVPWDFSLQQCTLFGQQYFVTEYLPSHPNHTLKSYRCVIQPEGGERHASESYGPHAG